MELTLRTAVATRAGSGIGEAIANPVGRERANVVINNRFLDRRRMGAKAR
jgi:NAD(P)-dependent dehydrogenase (short-subunit alcohol dehydrogenase family)